MPPQVAWEQRGYLSEGRGHIDRALASARDAAAALRAEACRGAGVLADDQGDYPQALAMLEESLRLWQSVDDRKEVARAKALLGRVRSTLGDYPAARRLLEESLAIERELDDRPAIAASLNNLGAMAFEQGDDADAIRFFEEALACFRALGNRRSTAVTLLNLGATVYHTGDLDRGEALARDALAEFRALGDRQATAVVLYTLGAYALAREDIAGAVGLYHECLALADDLDDRLNLARVFASLAEAALMANQPERSIRLFAAAEAARETIGAPLNTHELAEREGLMPRLRAALSPAQFARAWAAGHTMSPDAALTEAYAVSAERADHSGEGRTAAALGPNALTPRQLAVLRLLVEGRTDREIGEALFITRRTVSKHLEAIFAKLGVTSRTAAATAAHRAGLV